MNIHEYQAKALLGEWGLPVLPGYLCYTTGEVESAAERLMSGDAADTCVVKAQVHAGGRGKAGGIKVAESVEEAKALADAMLNKRLVTAQTGAQGKLVRKVYIEAGCEIDRELYLSLLINRSARCFSFVASAAGGTDIEELSAKEPEKIVRLNFDAVTGYRQFHGRTLGAALKLRDAQLKNFIDLCGAFYEFFVAHDLTLLEINPLVINSDGDFVLLDAKLNIDDSALYRHGEIAELRDYDEEDERERRAAALGVNYIGLDGNIGCLVNGAGLAMATMDIIKSHGGMPANFLDVGGGASKAMVSGAFQILLSDPLVQGILINIFGGILRCDLAAEGIVAATRELKLNLPIVVRLHGTNMEEGKKILAASGLNLVPAATMDEAAREIVRLVKTH